MDKATAWVRLKAMTAATSAPELAADEIEALLAMCRLADSAGAAPSDADWIPTYDLNRAATEGWRWKAGKAAGSYDFTADGATFNRAQIISHCEMMTQQYRRKIAGSLIVDNTQRYIDLAAAETDETVEIDTPVETDAVTWAEADERYVAEIAGGYLPASGIVTGAVSQAQPLSKGVIGPLMTPGEVVVPFTVPAGHTALYNNMMVGDLTVEVAGLLLDPGWS